MNRFHLPSLMLHCDLQAAAGSAASSLRPARQYRSAAAWNIVIANAALVICVVAAVLFPAEGHARNRCPAGETNCTLDNAHDRIRERVNEGARSILRNTNPNGRVNEARKTLDFCVRCGTEAIKDGMDRVQGDTRSRTSR